MTRYLSTGQTECYQSNGDAVLCIDSGQDGEFRTGIPWPDERFSVEGDLVIDHLTGLKWLRNANPAEFPLTWQEALNHASRMNADKKLGQTDWRLPNRRELRSIMAFNTRKPALPAGHPFTNVYLGWYWTSTSAAIQPEYAWSVHMEGARMFFGRKDQFYLFWPLCGQGKDVLPGTGQIKCYDTLGQEVPCRLSGQDGELRKGCAWPEPRFVVNQKTVQDKLTGLYWLLDADISSGTMNWEQALQYVKSFDCQLPESSLKWRLPTINELESFVDCSQHTPALPEEHPFKNVRDVYWSSTTSFFEPDWAWALYLNKGATGVGFKQEKGFHLWPVASKID